MMGTNHIEYDEYILEAETAFATHREWRRGQAYFNVLAQYRPDLSEKLVRGKKIDPFYQDDRLPDFLRMVKMWW